VAERSVAFSLRAGSFGGHPHVREAVARRCRVPVEINGTGGTLQTWCAWAISVSAPPTADSAVPGIYPLTVAGAYMGGTSPPSLLSQAVKEHRGNA
jgi:hypothetical protein